MYFKICTPQQWSLIPAVPCDWTPSWPKLTSGAFMANSIYGTWWRGLSTHTRSYTYKYEGAVDSYQNSISPGFQITCAINTILSCCISTRLEEVLHNTQHLPWVVCAWFQLFVQNICRCKFCIHSIIIIFNKGFLKFQ